MIKLSNYAMVSLSGGFTDRWTRQFENKKCLLGCKLARLLFKLVFQNNTYLSEDRNSSKDFFESFIEH